MLQSDKSTDRVTCLHPKDLLRTSLYKNDRQIREVLYAVQPGNVPGYRVRVYVL